MNAAIVVVEVQAGEDFAKRHGVARAVDDFGDPHGHVQAESGPLVPLANGGQAEP